MHGRQSRHRSLRVHVGAAGRHAAREGCGCPQGVDERTAVRRNNCCSVDILVGARFGRLGLALGL
jgi:hypothetical protein